MTSIVFVHGIRTGIGDRGWADALAVGLARRGTGTLEKLGATPVTVAWKDVLEGPEPEKDPGPPPATYARGDDEAHQQAVGRWSLQQSDLEVALKRAAVHRSGPSRLASGEALDHLAPALATVLGEVGRYVKSKDRRNACLRTVVEQLPPEGDVVLIGHSLGSVLAADLLYHLPPDVRIRLFVTIGSPLGRQVVRGHLRRMSDRFPFERVGPWLNVVGQWDPIAMGRGIGRHFPEALDTFADTGQRPLTAHLSSSYLEQDVVAAAIAWALGDPAPSSGARPEVLPALRVPEELLPVVIGAQFALRVEQQMEPGQPRTRFGQARAARARELLEEHRAADGGAHPVLEQLHRDLSDELRGRVSPDQALAVLLDRCMANAVTPYEVDYPGKVEARALADLANDLGFPARRADAVLEAEREARSVHGASKGWQRKALLAAGLTVLAAAFGPAGGMVGGLRVVGLLGSAGGAAIAGSLTTGSATLVEEQVIYLHALALAEAQLHEDTLRPSVWARLVEMETVLAAEGARLRRFSDPRARVLKELDAKSASVEKALGALAKAGLSPALIEAEDLKG